MKTLNVHKHVLNEDWKKEINMSPKEFLFLKKLLHVLIKNGKKAKALKIFLLLIKNLKSKNLTTNSSVDIIYQSLLNARPLIHIKKVRKSSKIFYLPKLISTEKRTNLALHWIIKSVNNRKENKLEDRLTNEFMDCFFSKGSTILKKQNLYDTIA